MPRRRPDLPMPEWFKKLTKENNKDNIITKLNYNNMKNFYEYVVLPWSIGTGFVFIVVAFLWFSLSFILLELSGILVGVRILIVGIVVGLPALIHLIKN